MATPSRVKCPKCGKKGDWFSGSYGPFCSRRCKLIDLGKWFSEEHAVMDPLQPGDVERLAEQSDGENTDRSKGGDRED